MAPRKRASKAEETSKDTSKAHAPPRTAEEPTTAVEAQEEPKEQGEGVWPSFQPTRYRKRSNGVKWFPVVKSLFYVSLLVLVPMILNYAALSHELRVLPPQGVYSSYTTPHPLRMKKFLLSLSIDNSRWPCRL